MELDSAFGPNVSPREFFETVLERLYDTYKADVSDASEIDVIVSVYLEDVDERWTILHERASQKLTIENDEMIDFPLVTIVGHARHWDAAKEGILPLAHALDARRDELRGQYRLTDNFRDDFERIDGAIEVVFTSESEDPLSLEIVFNNYEWDAAFPRIRVEVPYRLLQDVTSGSLDPGKAVRGLKFSGDRGFALEVGGLLATHFDR